jgi:hypothetical protein
MGAGRWRRDAAARPRLQAGERLRPPLDGATFVIAERGEITFAEVSNPHADRVEAKKALEAALD